MICGEKAHIKDSEMGLSPPLFRRTMSLYETSDGILETHVTWEDIQKTMQATFKTKAAFGDGKRATNISDMKGYMSIIALIDADWVNVEEDTKLPSRFAVKISTQLPLLALSKIMKFGGENGFGEEKLRELGKLSRKIHNLEVDTYDVLMRFNHPDIPFAKRYGSKKFESGDDVKGFLIIEYVPNAQNIGAHLSIPADDLIPAVRGIATFSALCEKLATEEKTFAGGPEYLEVMFEQFFGTSSLQKHFSQMHTVFGEEHHGKVNDLIKTFTVYQNCLKNYSKISEMLGWKSVFNHGDLWQSNMIFTSEKNGKLHLQAVIDWQSTVILPPGLDMSRLLMGCLSANDRREHGSDLLKLYQKTFNEVYGTEVLKWQELHDSYNLYFPMAAMLIIPGILTFMAFVSEEEKLQGMEKVTAIMEDVHNIHEYNLAHYPEFLRSPQ